MDKFGQYQLTKGDLVLIIDDCRNETPVKIEIVAKYAGKTEPVKLLGGTFPSPIFETKDDTFYGYNCFWLPLDVANEVLEEKGLPKIETVDVDTEEA